LKKLQQQRTKKKKKKKKKRFSGWHLVIDSHPSPVISLLLLVVMLACILFLELDVSLDPYFVSQLLA
jgi:hypothetical protein